MLAERSHDIDLEALPEREWLRLEQLPQSIGYRLGVRALLIDNSGSWVVINATDTLAAGCSRNGILGAARAGLRALGRLTRAARALSEQH